MLLRSVAGDDSASCITGQDGVGHGRCGGIRDSGVHVRGARHSALGVGYGECEGFGTGESEEAPVR